MIETNFTPFQNLITNRLILRPLETTDDKDIFAHRSNNDVNTFLVDFRHSSIEQTREFIDRVQKEIMNHKTLLWVITPKDTNKFIGTICLWNISVNEAKAEAGYTLDPQFQGMGYMNEALIKVIDFGFNSMKLKLIEAYTHENNQGSIKLLLKNKFRQDNTPEKQIGNNRIFFTLVFS